MKITKEQADLLVEKYETFYRKDLEIDGSEVLIYNYLLSDYEAFRDLDNLGTELRGLTLVKDQGDREDQDYDVFLSCPKFFNINEIKENFESVLKNKKIKKVLDKADGSLIQPVMINGEIRMKTKQSFDNDQAILSQSILDDSADLKFFILDCWDNNFFPLFELIGPSNRIVVDYPKNELVLTMVRNSEGEFIDIEKFNYRYTVESLDLTLDEMVQNTETKEGIEGYVVKFTDGSIVKIKTQDYLRQHRLVNAGESYKTVLELILDEKIDDVISTVQDEKRKELEKINDLLAEYVSGGIKDIISCIENAPENRSECAQKYLGLDYFSIIMKNLNREYTVWTIKDQFIQLLLKKYNKEKKAKEFLTSLA